LLSYAGGDELPLSAQEQPFVQAQIRNVNALVQVAEGFNGSTFSAPSGGMGSLHVTLSTIPGNGAYNLSLFFDVKL
jgi:hypothetical protein